MGARFKCILNAIRMWQWVAQSALQSALMAATATATAAPVAAHYEDNL